MRIELDDSEPLIWRRVLVDANSTLLDLHYVIQAVMNWDGEHLWEFKSGARKRSYREQVDVQEDENLDLRLRDIWKRAGQKIKYLYDLGDNWRHTVYVEEKLQRPPDTKLPVLLEAEMDAPMEDSGGLWGYYSMIEAIQDPEHPEHEEYMNWYPDGYDPQKVDLEKINQRLMRLREKGSSGKPESGDIHRMREDRPAGEHSVMPKAKMEDNSVVYQLKIELAYSKPTIWRRVLVDPKGTLTDLHYVIQDVMNWYNDHLWAFTVEEIEYSDWEQFSDLDDLDADDSNEITIAEALPKVKSKIQYIYDYGDMWEHVITLEKILPRTPDMNIPVCIKAMMAAPPEDCGGIWGYYNMLEIIKDPNHPEYEDWKDWVPEGYDPERVDLDEINARLQGAYEEEDYSEDEEDEDVK